MCGWVGVGGWVFVCAAGNALPGAPPPTARGKRTGPTSASTALMLSMVVTLPGKTGYSALSPKAANRVGVSGAGGARVRKDVSGAVAPWRWP